MKPRFGRRWRGSEAGRHEGGKYLAGTCRKGEPTSGLEPLTCSLRVIIQALQGLADDCKSRISKPLSLLCLALCCTVLRSRWYQSGIKWLGMMNRGAYATCDPFMLSPFPERE